LYASNTGAKLIDLLESMIYQPVSNEYKVTIKHSYIQSVESAKADTLHMTSNDLQK